jgi:ABC-type multidrug transport system ATPase subunit
MAGLLEVRDLIVGFGKSFRVGPVNFDMNQGVLHLKGPNGSGKSTLLRAMSGELLPSVGRVFVAGQDVHRAVEARRQIAFVPAISELPDFLSVTEAYEFTASIRGAHDWNGAGFCEELDLDPRLRLGNASAGERQKAELICGLAGDPLILLLDETFTHLDIDGSHKLREWIVEWSSSRLILITQHGGSPVPANATLSVNRGNVTFQRKLIVPTVPEPPSSGSAGS